MNVQTLRKAIASVSATALLLSTFIVPGMGVNVAQAAEWFQPYLDVASSLEMSTSDVESNPGANMNRCETAILYVEAHDAAFGVSDAEVEAAMEDVQFTDTTGNCQVAAELMLDWGLMFGQGGTEGNPSTTFGANDVLNKNDQAVVAFRYDTEVLGNDVETSSHQFGDVDYNAYYGPAISHLTARGYIVGEGGTASNLSNTFGNAAPANRITTLVMAFRVAELTDTDGEDTGLGIATVGIEALAAIVGGGSTVGTGGGLTVALASNSPNGGTIPLGATGVTLASFDFKASSMGSVTLNEVTFDRDGVGAAADFTNLYVYEGATRLRSGKTLANDTDDVTFALPGFTIAAGQTRTLSLRADIAGAATPSNQHNFSLDSASDIRSNASGVNGSFPLMGNTFTIGGSAVSTVRVDPLSISKPTIGQEDAELSKFKLTAGTEHIDVLEMTLTHGGSLSNNEIRNLTLKQGSTVLASAPAIIDGDRVVFKLDKPFRIDENQNRNFSVHGDIIGGKSTDTVRFYLEEQSDLLVLDAQFGYGAGVTNNFGSGAVNATALESGKVTIVDNSPAATTIGSNTTNVRVYEAGVTAERDLTIRDTDFILDQNLFSMGAQGTALVNNGAGYTLTKNTAVAIVVDTEAGIPLAVGDYLKSGGGIYLEITAAASPNYTVVPKTSGTLSDNEALTQTWDASVMNGAIDNFKLIDTDTGSTLFSVNTANGYIFASDDWTLSAGKTRHVAVDVDVDVNAVAGNAFSVGMALYDNYVKDDVANEFVAAQEIVGNVTQGNAMTIGAQGLTFSQSAVPTSQDFVQGSKEVPALGISVTADDAGSVTINDLTLRGFADDDGTFGAGDAGDFDAQNLVSVVHLYHGDVKLGSESGVAVGGTPGNGTARREYQFEDLDLMIESGETITLTAKVDLLNTSTGFFYLDLQPDNDVEAEDKDGNLLAAADLKVGPTDGTNFNISTAAATLAANPGLLTTVTGAGSLSAFVEGEADEQIVHGSETYQVNKYRFHALDEAFLVKKLTVINDAGGEFATPVATTAVQTVRLKYKDQAGTDREAVGTLSGGSVTFSGLTFYVPDDGDSYIEIWAQVTTIAAGGPGISGSTFRLGFLDNMAAANSAQFEALGMSSSTTITRADGTVAASSTNVSITGNAAVDTMVVRKTSPKFAVQSVSTVLNNGTVDMYKLQVSAPAVGSLTLARLVFTVQASGLAEVANVRLFDGSSLITSSNVVVSDGTNYATGVLGLDAADGTDNGTVADGSYSVIVTFNSPLVISAGGSKSLTLKGDITGASTNDSLGTKLAVGDENSPLTGLVATNNANTGQVCVTGDATAGIFVTCTNTPADGEFAAGADLTNRNIIWSDQSSNTFSYPTVTAGAVTTATGSNDYTNGHLLKTNNLSQTTLTF